MARGTLKNLSPDHRQNVVQEVLALIKKKYGAQVGSIEITQEEIDASGQVQQATEEEIDQVMQHLHI